MAEHAVIAYMISMHTFQATHGSADPQRHAAGHARGVSARPFGHGPGCSMRGWRRPIVIAIVVVAVVIIVISLLVRIVLSRGIPWCARVGDASIDRLGDLARAHTYDNHDNDNSNDNDNNNNNNNNTSNHTNASTPFWSNFAIM